ncbi:MAG: DUF5723 family protein [candidate division Zixibacteria bacterium]|nr:DUF5723 family protein [candidate division Zixibacteria bacterium]
MVVRSFVPAPLSRIIKGIILAIILLLLWADTSAPLGLSNARSLGLGGAYTALARGNEAPLWNPANLSFIDNRGFSLNLFSLGAFVENNAFSLKNYNAYNGKFWDDQDKDNILSLVPSSGLNLNAQAEASALGLSIGSFSLVSYALGVSDLSFPKDPFELLLVGNQMNDTVSLKGTSGEAYAYAALSFSFGKSILRKGEKEIGIGVNLKYLQGIVYQKVMKASGEVRIQETGMEGQSDLILNSAMGGKGYGLDLGIAAKLNRKWTVGLFFSNPISRIKWDRKTEERGYQFQIDSLNLSNSGNDSVFLSEDYQKDIDPFITHLPLTAKAGISYQAKKILIAFDWEQGFENGPGVSKTPRLSLGTEIKFLSFLPLRTGLSLGGREGFSLSGGFGLDFGLIFLDLGIVNKNALLPNNSKGVGLSLDCGLRF